LAEDRLPDRYEPRTPASSAGRVPARAGDSAAPVHRPTELQFGRSAATREELWSRLSPTVQEKVNQRVGRVLQWWATDNQGPVSATVLGHRALVIVSPATGRGGAPATEISTIGLAEESFRAVSIHEPHAAAPPAPVPPPQRAAPGVGPGIGPGARPGEPVAPLAGQLDDGMAGFLGQLPRRAQQLVQDPFLGAPQDLRYDYYFYRTGKGHGITGATLYVWCYFTDLRQLTFCAGQGLGYREVTGPTHWELTCWRAQVVPRTGGGGR
jgi:hypothetical protein